MINELLFIEAPLPGFFGSVSLYACHPRCPGPVGFIWLRFPVLNCTEILHIFVLEDYRRKGVATALLNEARRRLPSNDIIGAQSTSFSAPWMIKNGFQENRNGWILKGQ